MKHSLSLLILANNTIFFKYCNILDCGLLYLFQETSALKNGRPFVHFGILPDKRSLLSKDMVELPKLPAINSNTMSTTSNTSFLSTYY